MALNVHKSVTYVEYYYAKDGVALGPYQFPEIMEFITADSLVWHEGISWTTANKIPELAPYFQHEQTKDEEKLGSKMKAENSTPISGSSFNSTSFFRAPFYFSGRIRRSEYVISFVVYLICYMLVFSLAESGQSKEIYIFFIPLFWFIWAQGAKRCHDRSNSGWFQIIPFYFIWLMFADSMPGINEYGLNPKGL